jgi:hypothetical protein
MKNIYEVTTNGGRYDRNGFEMHTDFNCQSYRFADLLAATACFEAQKKSLPAAYFEQRGSVTDMVRYQANLLEFVLQDDEEAAKFLDGCAPSRSAEYTTRDIANWQNSPITEAAWMRETTVTI